ncbi:MAG: hypothetical protein WC736_00580 [Gallionella sp.]|jgi:hypothetical protein
MPIYRFKIDVLLPPEVVLDRLQSVTGKRPGAFQLMRTMFGTSNSQANLFFGSVKDCCFHLERNIHGKNPFLPCIRGEISPANSGTHINVMMHLQPFVAILQVFGFFVVGRIAFSVLNIQGFWVFTCYAIFAIVFGVIIPLCAFFYEAKRDKTLLMSLWQKEPISNRQKLLWV